MPSFWAYESGAMPLTEHHSRMHSDPHAFTFMNPRVRDGVIVHSGRSVLKTSLVGCGTWSSEIRGPFKTIRTKLGELI